jgi:dihydroorotate dehydrogenase
MYSLVRKALFSLSPETAHELSLDMMGAAQRLRLLSLFSPDIKDNEIDFAGVTLSNPVGLAAGLDKNGDYIDALGELGFGFIEIGTITPRPQPGNPHPRLFRIPEAGAIINRMGFNNKGVDHLVEQVKKRKWQGTLGINIGKNFDTPVENALDDYIICMQKVYDHADYIAVNLSSPNTPGLRDLQFGESLRQLLKGLKAEQKALAEKFEKHVPVFVKIAPDMTDEEMIETANTFIEFEIDGIIGTNTTITRDVVSGLQNSEEMGGLSGAPVFDLTTEKLAVLTQALQGKIPVIGVGGINSGERAKDKILAGATAVQVYSGFIYEGPKLIKDSAQAISELMAE